MRVQGLRRLVAGAGFTAAGLGGLVVGTCVFLEVAHVGDTYHVSHVTGAWFALARYVNEGTLYPPLFDGSHFGGTRFMPLQFVAHAGVARVTGEYLVSGKLYAYVTAAGAFAVLFAVMRRVGRSTLLALGLCGALLATETGLEAATTVRGDALPAGLQLGAVALVERGGRRRTVAAGVLCGLALVSKLSAVWAPAAIVVWLFVRDRRRLLEFAAAFLLPLGALLAVFQLASGGRMSENILHLAGTGSITPRTVFRARHQLLFLAEHHALALELLLPVAAIAFVVAAVRRELTIFHVSLVAAGLVLLAVLTDVGADWNHLLDLEFLTAVVVADLFATLDVTAPRAQIARGLVLVIVAVATIASYQGVAAREALETARTLSSGHSGTPLAGVLTRSGRVFSEDPYVPLSRGRDPVVLDPFMLLRVDRRHPSWQDALVRRIDADRFTEVVLLQKLDPSVAWWRYGHFGTPVIDALAHHYRFAETVPRYYRPDDATESGRYWVYLPKKQS